MEPFEIRDVFLNHTHPAARRAALRLADLLEAQGIRCWIAPRDIPDNADWQDVMPQAIQHCRMVVNVADTEALDTPDLLAAQNWALHYRKPTIPIALAPLTPSRQLEHWMRERHWVQATPLNTVGAFSQAVQVIRSALENTGHRLPPLRDTAMVARANTLCQTLNATHAARFDSINAFFTVRTQSEHMLSLHFPIRMGAGGVDIHLMCDVSLQRMNFSADLHNLKNPLHTPFKEVCARLLRPMLGAGLEMTPPGTEPGLVQFYEQSANINPLFAQATEAFLDLFEQKVSTFAAHILPYLLDWVDYGQALERALTKLVEALEVAFPKEKGWCVQTHSGNALTDFRAIGSVDIFRDSWVPEEYRRRRGQLTFRIQVDGALLSGLKFGIFKRERNLRLEGWENQLRSACTTLSGEADFKSDWWVWCRYLPSPWNESGLATFEPQWKSPDELSTVCVDALKSLTPAIPLIDTIHQTLPILQTVPVDQLNEAPWGALLLRSALSHSAEVLQTHPTLRMLKPALQWKVRLEEVKGENQIASAQLYAPVYTAGFNYVIVARCTPEQMQLSIENWVPPHFEMHFIREFIQVYFPNLTCVDLSRGILSTRTALDTFDGLPPADWLSTFEVFLIEEIERIEPLLHALQAHLEICLKLIAKIQETLQTLLPPSLGWHVEDHASSLRMQQGGFLIWHQDWLPENVTHPSARPPLVLQLGSVSRLFDQLFWALHTTAPLPANADQAVLRTLVSTCDKVLGKGQIGEFAWLWRTPASPVIYETGCRTLVDGALSAEKQTQFLMNLSHTINRLQLIFPLLTQTNHMLNGLQPDGQNKAA